jgi:acetyl-CoA carboxylase carboxyl transferase subunit alpha
MGFGLIDGIIPEALGGAQQDTAALYAALDKAITDALCELDALNAQALIENRYDKYRKIGLA